MNYFAAGHDLVRWDLEVVETTRGQHVRLTMLHSCGSIVEYFPSTATALCREQELEHLLIAARGFAGSAPMGMSR
jgi:hypothetical protein